MDCQEVKERLLQADALDKGMPSPQLDEHIKQCPRCHEFYRRLCRLEHAVQLLPQPAGTDEAIATFHRIVDWRNARVQSRARRHNWLINIPRPYLAVAATIILAIAGLAIWQVVEARQETARAVLLAQLVSWNTDLGQVASPEQRSLAFSQGQNIFQQRIQEVRLPAGQKRLARRLMEDAAWLARHDDPVAQTDHFSAMAAMLVDEMDGAASRGQTKLLRSLGQSYYVVLDKGVNPNLAKMKQPGVLKADRDGRLAKVVLTKKQLRARLRALINRSPAAAREDMTRALLVSGEGQELDQPQMP